MAEDKERTSSQLLSQIIIHMKYARFDKDKGRRETWNEVVDRNKKMHHDFFAKKLTKQRYAELIPYIEDAYEYVYDKRVLPSMRSMQFAGKPVLINPSRVFNCLAVDTEFITSEGVKSFLDFEDGDTISVLSHTGEWNNATVRSYGKQQLYRYSFKRGRAQYTVRATSDHRWLLVNESETTSIGVKDILHRSPNIFDEFQYEDADPVERLYWCYGFVYGDGTRLKDKSGEYKYSMLRLCGNDAQFENRFLEVGFKSSSPHSINGDCMVYTGTYLKTTPDPKIDSPNLIKAFVAGYLQADGEKNNDKTMVNSYKSIQSSDVEHLCFIKDCFPIAGVYIQNSRDLTGEETNYGKRPFTLKFSVYQTIGKTNSTHWALQSIEKELEEEVWCLEVESDHSFVLPCGIVTGNCAYLPIESVDAFAETMFLLLGGTGVGFSVQKHHVEKLPIIRKPVKSQRFLVGDSIEGWADAVRRLVRSYLDGKTLPLFDFSDIRPKGAQLVTSGGKAPGPDPLRECLYKIQSLFDIKEDGSQLSSLDCNDIMCIIADAVLAGGIRRAALISLFSLRDTEMMEAKGYVEAKVVEKINGTTRVEHKGKVYDLTLRETDLEHVKAHGTLPWYYFYPYRARSNNSVVLDRSRVKKNDFYKVWNAVHNSGSGEPGFYFTNNVNYGTNPCCEISLKPYQFCNLTTIPMANVGDERDFHNRIRSAAIIGTLQAAYTDFHYLREVWQRNTEKDALIGISMTGIVGCPVLDDLSLEDGAEIAKAINKEIAALIGIKEAARITTIKPEGTSTIAASSDVALSSGIHAYHDDYWIRHLRVNKNEAIYKYLEATNSAIIEDEYGGQGAVIKVPQKAPPGAVTRSESAIEFLTRVKSFYMGWILPGHRSGPNTNNVSATVNVRKEEWREVGDWLWANRKFYNGISVLPYDGGVYQQAPFETISKVKYNSMIDNLSNIDITAIKEDGDYTDLKGEIACSGPEGCEVSLI